jgi:L-threonylcarbamoyladenylate synthase
MPQILEPVTESFEICKRHLERGFLVAFPTETVFGLGASLFSLEGIQRIFDTKGRPMTNPLIAHVSSLEMANAITDLSQKEKEIFTALTTSFWPGPLTLVVNKAAHVPLKATANQPTIALRMPRHPVALGLIETANVPLVAPSANRSGHISATHESHVLEEFKEEKELIILKDTEELLGGCYYGIESTILKIEEDTLTVLRPGSLTLEDLLEVLKKANITIREACYLNSFVTDEDTSLSSPGQLLTHYASFIPSFILKEHLDVQGILGEDLKKAALIDFEGRYEPLKPYLGWYKDLSAVGDLREASHHLFDYMRQAEGVLGLKILMLPCFDPTRPEQRALFDRIFRACSGQYIKA